MSTEITDHNQNIVSSNASTKPNLPIDDAVPKIYDQDQHLKPFIAYFNERDATLKWMARKVEDLGGLDSISTSYLKYGIHTKNGTDFTCTEYIPNVKAVHLCGDFNDWRPTEYPYKQTSPGTWTLNFSTESLHPNSKLKLSILTEDNRLIYRLSPWARYVKQFPTESPLYQWIYQGPENSENSPEIDGIADHVWAKPGLKIYEAHVGICTEKEGISTYSDFENLLPKIADLGYNCIQLMAVMEHAYYGSFGYQVTSFFAASSRFGTPDSLKRLIRRAHALEISVFLDVVHSHASKNIDDGLNDLNGNTDHPVYFRSGWRGDHPQWGSKIFDYGSAETVRFMISNLRMWVDEFGFDGFRFDGVTSMLYKDHAVNRGFSGDYHEYFGDHVDNDSLCYLQIANQFLHKNYPNIVTVAEEVSGMPGTCKPVSQGGLGFDYRLAMAIPDKWIKTLKECKDEDWPIGEIFWTLVNRRHDEAHICYAESHDQALVGDKSLAFHLMDAEMYTNMSVMSEETAVISRGLALHKMIRMITHTLGGEAYLNFIGNEFGHPEWLDFPRAGNGESYKYARRQFNLVSDSLLRYRHLNAFDRALQHAENQGKWLHYPKNHGFVSKKCDSDKLIAFERNECIFVFNFHPTKSFTDYRIGTNLPGKYKILLSTDEKDFHGHENLTKNSNTEYFSEPFSQDDRDHSLRVYIPARVGVIFMKCE